MTTRLVFAGYGGQGVILAGKLLAVAAMRSGKNVSHIPSYGVEMRGGTANCSVVVSDEAIPSPLVSSPDVACIFNEPSLVKFGPQVRKGGLLLYNSSLILSAPVYSGVTSVPVPANAVAEESGSSKAANMAMLGALVSIVPQLAALEALIDALKPASPSMKKEHLVLNEKALRGGYEAVKEKMAT